MKEMLVKWTYIENLEKKRKIYSNGLIWHRRLIIKPDIIQNYDRKTPNIRGQTYAKENSGRKTKQN